jgi:hypothetical protein
MDSYSKSGIEADENGCRRIMRLDCETQLYSHKSVHFFLSKKGVKNGE